jgi:hypothetical protein
MVLGRSGECYCICDEHVFDKEHGWHDPVRGVAWEEASSAPPHDVWVHHIHLEHDTAPEEVEGPWLQDDLHWL